MQVKLTKFGLYRIPVYSVFGFDRFHIKFITEILLKVAFNTITLTQFTICNVNTIYFFANKYLLVFFPNNCRNPYGVSDKAICC